MDAKTEDHFIGPSPPFVSFSQNDHLKAVLQPPSLRMGMPLGLVSPSVKKVYGGATYTLAHPHGSLNC